MKIFSIMLLIMLAGCAEQKPVDVVAAQPSTYQPLAVAKPSKSRVEQKMQLAKQNQTWGWPTKSRALQNLTVAKSQKGIDILGQEGSPIVAAADGEVVYSGNALKGYGNLVIIKHKKNFLTAYAHNRKNMVKEGDKVVIGQKIAEMGKSGTDRVKLHFEVRQDGKPIDPKAVLPK